MLVIIVSFIIRITGITIDIIITLIRVMRIIIMAIGNIIVDINTIILVQKKKKNYYTKFEKLTFIQK